MLELRAQSFVVTDSTGDEKGRLSCDDAGTVRLVLGSAGSSVELTVAQMEGATSS